ncbi:hypothetical protein AYX13_07109 [Cryptococcus neoformans]|nr:hypothetical protein AYX13_07109 [Cryptococcus neoformans var. grubii]
MIIKIIGIVPVLYPPLLPAKTATGAPLAREAVGPNLLDEEEPYDLTLASL